MKTIGFTTDNQQIITMSREEHEEFVLLQKAVQGKNWMWDNVGRDKGIDTDLLPTFQAILKWTQLRFLINDLVYCTSSLKVALGEKQ